MVGIMKKKDFEQQQFTGYISDESDFYGDEGTKRRLELRAEAYPTAALWEHRHISITELAEEGRRTQLTQKNAEMHNPYAGIEAGRQLDETVPDFLKRLPASRTPVSDRIPWIFIANPYLQQPSIKKTMESKELSSAEAPFQKGSDWEQFLVRGDRLTAELSEFTSKTKNGPLKKMAQNSAIKKKRESIVQSILNSAAEFGCTTGKWMLFCYPHEVDLLWAAIAKATAGNELGIAAKVAPSDGNPDRVHLICVYTIDFTNTKDVSRVLCKLRDLGIIETKGKPLYYKCDAYTYLGFYSKNEWNIKASLYSSTEFFESKGGK